MRCAAHTYQLAINDWFKSLSNVTKSSEKKDEDIIDFDADEDNDSEDQSEDDDTEVETNSKKRVKLSLLDKVRRTVKKFRTHKFKIELRKLGVDKKFVLDCVTR